MALTPATNRQVPDHAILDYYNKQAYLGNQFVYNTGSLSIASTAETGVFLLQAGSSLAIPVQGKPSAVFMNARLGLCLTASQNAIFKAYFNPAFSDTGVLHTPVNVRPASSLTSFATISTLPTVTSNGTFVEQFVSVNPTQAASTIMLILDYGQSLLLTATCSANPTSVSVQMVWYEM